MRKVRLITPWGNTVTSVGIAIRGNGAFVLSVIRREHMGNVPRILGINVILSAKGAEGEQI